MWRRTSSWWANPRYFSSFSYLSLLRKAFVALRRSVLVILTIFLRRRSVFRRFSRRDLMAVWWRISSSLSVCSCTVPCPSFRVHTMLCIPCGWSTRRRWRDSNGHRRMWAICSRWWDQFRWSVDISFLWSCNLGFVVGFLHTTPFEWICCSCIWIQKDVVVLWILLPCLHSSFSS